MYYNTQSELNVLTFGEIMYYQSNNLTTRAIGLGPSFLFLYSGLFDWLHLMVFPVANGKQYKHQHTFSYSSQFIVKRPVS
jgi:hypothetical protein